MLQRTQTGGLTPQQDRALELNALGIQVVAIKNGEKYPSHKWGDITDQTPEDVLGLITPDVERIGAICGARSNGFSLFEFEAEAVRRGLDKRFVDLLMAEPGGIEVWNKIKFWQERSASGGRHFHWFCPADPQPNIQLAADANGQVLIETRGEGGQVVMAPSDSHISGATTPDGKPQRWETKAGGPEHIATLTPDEQHLIFKVARQLNERVDHTPEVPVEVQAADETPADNVRHLDNRIDDYINDFNRKPWAEVLSPMFTHVRDVEIDGRAVGYWKYTGQKSPVGAYTNFTGNNTLIVFSGTAKAQGWETYTGAGKTPSYDKFSAWAKIRHKGDRMAALHAIGFRTPTEQDEELGINQLAKSQVQRHAEQDTASDASEQSDDTSLDDEQQHDEATDDNALESPWEFMAEVARQDLNGLADLYRLLGLSMIDLTVDDNALQLPAGFWAARPTLTHIRQAADNALAPADAVLGATLGLVALHTDYRFILPALGDQGRAAPLNVHIGLVGGSGGGKGSALDLAEQLVDPREQLNYKTRQVSAGSGEGMTKAFFTRQKDPDDKRTYIHTRTYDGILVRVDEGEFVTNLAARQGQTTLQVMRTAWSGEHLGGTYSNEDKNLSVPAYTYRWVILAAVQPTLAGPLLGDEAGGTAQRQLWFSLQDPNITGTSPNPGPLNWRPPRWTNTGEGIDKLNNSHRTFLDVERVIRHDIRAERIAAIRDPNTAAPGHRNLAKLKTAALLALLEGRLNVTAMDWHLAECIHTVSDNLARMMHDAIAVEQQHAARRQGAIDAARSTSRRNEADWMAGAAVSLAQWVHKDGPHTPNRLKNRLNSNKRYLFDSVSATAVAHGWIAWNSSTSRWVPGSQKPP